MLDLCGERMSDDDGSTTMVYGDDNDVDECLSMLNYTRNALQTCLVDLFHIQQAKANRNDSYLQCSWKGFHIIEWIVIVCVALFGIVMGLCAGLSIFVQWYEYKKKKRSARKQSTRFIFNRKQANAVRARYTKAQLAEDWEKYILDKDPHKKWTFSVEEACEILRELKYTPSSACEEVTYKKKWSC